MSLAMGFRPGARFKRAWSSAKNDRITEQINALEETIKAAV